MRTACIVWIAAAGLACAAQTSTSKATQAGQTTPKTSSKNAQDDQSGTTGSNTGLPPGAGATSPASSGGKAVKGGVSRKHRKHHAAHLAPSASAN